MTEYEVVFENKNIVGEKEQHIQTVMRNMFTDSYLSGFKAVVVVVAPVDKSKMGAKIILHNDVDAAWEQYQFYEAMLGNRVAMANFYQIKDFIKLIGAEDVDS